MSFNSFNVTFVPLAKTVPKSFVALFRVILPVATKFAVPLTVRLPAPDSSIWPPVTSVRLPNVMALVIAIVPVVLLPIVRLLAVI